MSTSNSSEEESLPALLDSLSASVLSENRRHYFFDRMSAMLFTSVLQPDVPLQTFFCGISVITLLTLVILIHFSQKVIF